MCYSAQPRNYTSEYATSSNNKMIAEEISEVYVEELQFRGQSGNYKNFLSLTKWFTRNPEHRFNKRFIAAQCSK